jgi:DNA-binding PadR family transcriptional regulator
MQLEQIYNFFEHPQLNYLNKELAVCYILSELLSADAYASELLVRLPEQHPDYRLSDTVLYKALRFLNREGLLNNYLQRQAGRGRPRNMLSLRPEALPKAEELANLWRCYMTNSQVGVQN